MAIKIPDTLRPDNGTYPIVDSQDIKGGLKGVNTKEELALISSARYRYSNPSSQIISTSFFPFKSISNIRK